MYCGNEKDVAELIGKTITDIKNDNNRELKFICSDGSEYLMYHSQDCCESVYIEDINGNLTDLINTPIIQAEESSNRDNPPEHADSFLWTFYKFATIKGYVTIRWLGESNGYYSESVDFVKTN